MGIRSIPAKPVPLSKLTASASNKLIKAFYYVYLNFQEMTLKKIFFGNLLLLLPYLSLAQEKTNNGTFSFSPAFELLRSTHGNLFYAPSLKLNHLFANGLELGFGTEYATTPIHHDNGYVLYKLKFLPIYGNLKYNFKTIKKIRPYVETSLGISFNKYYIAEDPTPDIRSKVSEEGFYVYTGFGLKYGITPKLDTFLAVGLKGYKMSTNELDINPHGLSFTLGFTFL